MTMKFNIESLLKIDPDDKKYTTVNITDEDVELLKSARYEVYLGSSIRMENHKAIDIEEFAEKLKTWAEYGNTHVDGREFLNAYQILGPTKNIISRSAQDRSHNYIYYTMKFVLGMAIDDLKGKLFDNIDNMSEEEISKEIAARRAVIKQLEEKYNRLARRFHDYDYLAASYDTDKFDDLPVTYRTPGDQRLPCMYEIPNKDGIKVFEGKYDQQ